MALSFLYLMTRRLLGMLLGSLRSGHTKDIEIAAPPPARGAAPPSQAPRVPSPRPRGPRDAEQRASSSALVELACHCGHDPALASPAGDPQVDAGPTLGRAPRACQRCGCADPAAGPREPALGLPAHPGRAEKARDVDVSDHDPNGSAALLELADWLRSQSVPPRPGLVASIATR